MPTHMTYNFNTFNTTDFVVMIGKLGQIPLSVTQVKYATGEFATFPGYLGEVLQFTDVNTAVLSTGGVAQSSANTCP